MFKKWEQDPPWQSLRGLCYSCSSSDENQYYSQPNMFLDAAHAVLNGKPNGEDIPGIFLGGKFRFSRGTEASFCFKAALEQLG